MTMHRPLELRNGSEHTGRWHYTTTWNGGKNTMAHACCLECEHKDDGHPSSEEAVECYRQYAAKKASIHTSTEEQHKCEECGSWTQYFAQAGTEMLAQIWLCPDHQSPKIIAKHFKV